MRPPICAICGKRFDPSKGKLIYFMRRPSDEEWHKTMKEKHLVGHPPEAEWFCENHYKRALELQHLTIDKAFEILEQEFQ
ncbi:MAG: hypothetical protein ACTSQI_20325 [Candidatus Helarchaeota archaeon]